RGWTVPGTLWCGAGDSAGNATELGTGVGTAPSGLGSGSGSGGVFRGPDRCCREHDQCEAQITALQFNYGIRNYRLHTVSHCDCDARCAGASPGSCRDPVGVVGAVGAAPLTPCPKPAGARRKRPRQGLGRGPGLRRARRPVTTQQVQDTGASSPVSARDEAEPTAGRAAPWGELEPGLPTAVMCRCYKRLDKCEHQIAPHEMKYQLHNADNRTLFHCNCTRRSVSKLMCVPSSGPF
uniref:Phospholipase A2-like central domain-containing protein n=1 Tax=Anas zonorhyncha TaxID=75864 RepID=A0A8B9UWE7_9AVES